LFTRLFRQTPRVIEPSLYAGQNLVVQVKAMLETTMFWKQLRALNCLRFLGIYHHVIMEETI
jgi:hypothetical protein